MNQEFETLEELRIAVENKIRERGGEMHTESQIKTYKFGDNIMLKLEDVLELCRKYKKKFREGTERGFMADSEQERIIAFYAINKLQLAFLSDELSKVDNIDDHKRIIEKYAKKGE